MNERLIAAAACDYEDGASSITHAFAEGVTSNRLRITKSGPSARQ